MGINRCHEWHAVNMRVLCAFLFSVVLCQCSVADAAFPLLFGCSSLDSPVPNLLAYKGTTLDGPDALFLKPYDSEVSERNGALLLLPAQDQALNSVSRWMSDCTTELYLALTEICGSCFTTGSKKENPADLSLDRS